jgi:hypothetical protein
MSKATVSANVGMLCLGSLMVRTCCIPWSPYHVLSLISPAPTGRNFLSATQLIQVTICLPLESVVRPRATIGKHTIEQGGTESDKVGGIPGSWNMMTTSSDDTWTSRWGVTRGGDFIRHVKYRFRCPRRHLGWQPQSWQVCSRESATRPRDEISTGTKYTGVKKLLHDDPNNLHIC